MKKFLLIAFSAILMITTSACTKSEYTISIDKNNKVIIDEISALNIDGLISLAGSMGNMDSSDIKNDLESQMEETAAEMQSNGYTVQKYDKDGYFGLETTISYSDFESTKLPEGFSYSGDSFISSRDSAFKKHYQINMKFNPILQTQAAETNANKIKAAKSRDIAEVEAFSGIENENTITTQRLMKNMGLNPIFTLTLKLPSKAKTTNASIKEDETFTYTWNLDIERDTIIKAEYEVVKTTNIIILCLVLLLLLGAAVYLHNKNETPQGF